MRGYAELYRSGMAPDADMVLGKIEQESARMQLLVEDLLALTRAEGTRLEKKQLDMLQLTADVASSARAAFPGRVIHINHDCTRPPVVEGDPDRLHQVLLNLISNAFKHAGEDAEVTITLRDNLDRLFIGVADNGVGMSPEDAEHIFERFYRADTSRHRAAGGGSGLGLAITKSLVEQHDGTISVVSAPGEGSTFTISLPLPA
ncbi:sensor histidine kinase [Corynebacterium aquatimens]|uniref:sensor histidine kinase n=1 Tax=Corynebacterium aquatimens TaxID=1190508 RepID=UPI0025402F13|nr:HAMP domain-containing sensor histidine kinase [Corynebacterium aquatimens]